AGICPWLSAHSQRGARWKVFLDKITLSDFWGGHDLCKQYKLIFLKLKDEILNKNWGLKPKG
ncbi:MAG: hypothetical protein NC821_05850, partial [Candidatus Omnitrophica bacterium]|nr:hypothetical protein [Candidatus Omnitrophota bacterium]